MKKFLLLLGAFLSLALSYIHGQSYDFTVENGVTSWVNKYGSSRAVTGAQANELGVARLYSSTGEEVERLDSAGLWPRHTINGDTTESLVEFASKLRDVNVQSTPLDVNLQDQVTDVFIGLMNQTEIATTTTADASLNGYTIEVANSTGIYSGQYLILINEDSVRYYVGYVTGVNGDTISLSSQLDFAFPSGSVAIGANTNMAVDGSVTPQVFGLRTAGSEVAATIDITRIMIFCTTNSSCDLSTFGDIPGGLERGLLFRRVDGYVQNIFAARTNGEMKNLMYDFDIQVASGNQQDGFTGRLTFAGQNKIGVVLRLGPGEDVNAVVQDDLSSIDGLFILCEGHVVDY